MFLANISAPAGSLKKHIIKVRPDEYDNPINFVTVNYIRVFSLTVLFASVVAGPGLM